MNANGRINRSQYLAYAAIAIGVSVTAWAVGVGAGIVIGALTTLVGWIVSHHLSLQAQRQQFLDRVLHESAQQLDRELRRHSDWLGHAHMVLFNFKWIDRLDNEQSPEKWRAAAETLRRNLFAADLDWLFALEALEILFPESTDCRLELGKLEQGLLERVRMVALNFLKDDVQVRLVAFQESERLSDHFSSQQALFEDLRRHIQNKALGKITGNSIPPRVPLDPKQPVLDLGLDGKLHVVEAGLPLRP